MIELLILTYAIVAGCAFYLGATHTQSYRDKFLNAVQNYCNLNAAYKRLEAQYDTAFKIANKNANKPQKRSKDGRFAK